MPMLRMEQSSYTRSFEHVDMPEFDRPKPDGAEIRGLSAPTKDNMTGPKRNGSANNDIHVL